MPNQKSPVFLYTVLIKNPIDRTCGIPLAECLSNDHHSCKIRHFLERLIVHLIANSSSYMSRRIETDFSWAILQAVVGSFNSQDLLSYLYWAWSVINLQKLSREIRTRTYLHICFSHMIQILFADVRDMKLIGAQLNLYLDV